MARGVGSVSGGIHGLLDVLERHREAVEYDLIALGLRLRYLPSERFDWGDLLAIIRQSRPPSRIALSIDPEAIWGLDQRLAAETVNALRTGVWQRGGGKGRRPKPIGPPDPAGKETRKFGTKPMTRAQMDAWLGWPNDQEVKRA